VRLAPPAFDLMHYITDEQLRPRTAWFVNAVSPDPAQQSRPAHHRVGPLLAAATPVRRLPNPSVAPPTAEEDRLGGREGENMRSSCESKTDALAQSISCALTGIYGAARPPEQVWERITGRVARLCRAGDRGRYRRIQPRDSMVGLEPHTGLARVPPMRR
jgi:hypothetical protein